MKGKIKILNDLAKKEIIYLSKFYAMCITEKHIQLQAHFRSDIVQQLRNKEIEYTYEILSPGYLNIEFMFDGILIQITLT